MNFFHKFSALPQGMGFFFCFDSLQSIRKNGARKLFYCQFVQRQFHTSTILWKGQRGDKKGHKMEKVTSQIAVESVSQNIFVQGAAKEMKRVEEILDDQLNKHFSLQTDLRQYEELLVKLDSGEECKLNRLGRVSLLSPNVISINFADNPAAIKAAKVALQSISANPQQEGITLFINLPRMTRERREQLVNNAKTKLFNDFKHAINEIYANYDRKATDRLKTRDDALRTRNVLLSMKRSLETKAASKIDSRKDEILKEVA